MEWKVGVVHFAISIDSHKRMKRTGNNTEQKKMGWNIGWRLCDKLWNGMIIYSSVMIA